MNAKKCKRIRRVCELFDTSWREARYTTGNFGKPFVDMFGNLHYRPDQRVLSPGCGRWTYRQMKKGHKNER